jgi:hypothetical protein
MKHSVGGRLLGTLVKLGGSEWHCRHGRRPEAISTSVPFRSFGAVGLLVAQSLQWRHFRRAHGGINPRQESDGTPDHGCQEGGGRAEFTGLPFLSGALRSLEGLGTIFGRNQTVGIGQMRPDVAQRLFRDYYGHEISTSDARRVLAWDDTWGIRLAAAELRYIKEELGVTDREAYVIYAAGAQTEATRLWLSGAPRERAPLVYERADGAEKHHQWAEEYLERAGQEDGRDRERRTRQEERELHEGDMQR